MFPLVMHRNHRARNLLSAGVLIVSGLVNPYPGLAQPGPEFEVASVKQSHLPPPTPMDAPIGPSAWSTADPGRFAYKNMWLRVILSYAYAVRPDEISGPGWIDSERYDITAKV